MEDFVSFEIAKKLKEKGFREPCFGWYHPSGVCVYGYLTLLIANQSDCRGCDYDDLLESHNDDKHIDAPTISQVLQWLREEKNILLAPNPACFKEDCCLSWDCDVWAYGNYNHCCVDYKTYEKASIAGIEYVINNLI